MDKSRKRRNSIRNIPKVRKSKAKRLYSDKGLLHEWLLFAEGLLRNQFFYEKVLSRMDSTCDWCIRKFNREDASIQSRVELHHREYMHSCTYKVVLSEDHKDIRRSPVDGEYSSVPDCRSCYLRYCSNGDRSFWNCFNLIKPLHAACHEHLHNLEFIRRGNSPTTIQDTFRSNSIDYVSTDQSSTDY